MGRAALLVVAHATDHPAVDSLVAGALAEALRADAESLTLCRFAPLDAGCRVPGCAEHVARAGALQANGMFWLERAGRDVEILGDLPERETAGRTILSVNPALLDAETLSALREWAAARGQWASVVEADGGFDVFHGSPESGARLVRSRLFRDAFGRLPPLDPDEILPELRARFGGAPATKLPLVRDKALPGPRLVIVGSRSHHHDVYPAALASLGDAVDHLGLVPEIGFLDHRDVPAAEWEESLRARDGLLLPGGSDMSQADGQIAAATAALAQDLPTLGLCLGMQTMTTAFLRARCGVADAALEEISPEAPIRSFIRALGANGAPVHYLGEREIAIAPDTRLAEFYGSLRTTERLNHRYYLNPDFVPRLAQAGLQVSAATADTAGVAEGVEAAAQRFFIGIQGHPELKSRRAAPHPVVSAFLRAASRHKTHPTFATKTVEQETP
jgi:CTP synthase